MCAIGFFYCYYYPLVGRLNNHNDDGSENTLLWLGVDSATKFTKLTVFRCDLAKTTKLTICYDGIVKTAKFTKLTIFKRLKSCAADFTTSSPFLMKYVSETGHIYRNTPCLPPPPRPKRKTKTKTKTKQKTKRNLCF